MASAFSRTTIFCRDIDASLALYEGILGFPIIDDKTLEGTAAGALLGAGSCTLRIVLLGETGSESPCIGLFQISDAELPTLPSPPTNTMAIGQTATVVSTDDFDSLYEALKDAGTPFLTDAIAYPKKQASPGSPAGLYKEAICFDPDGNLVSIMQIQTLESE